MPRSLDRPQVSIRLDQKTFYLLELATRIEDRSTSEVIRAALDLYFQQISPHRSEDFEEATPGTEPPTLLQRQESKAKAEAELKRQSLAKLADLLWFDEPEKRLQMLAAAYPHLVTETEWKEL